MNDYENMKRECTVLSMDVEIGRLRYNKHICTYIQGVH